MTELLVSAGSLAAAIVFGFSARALVDVSTRRSDIAFTLCLLGGIGSFAMFLVSLP